MHFRFRIFSGHDEFYQDTVPPLVKEDLCYLEDWFILERERENVSAWKWGGAEGEGGRESPADTLLSGEANAAQTHGPEIMTPVEIKIWSLNELSQPDAPKKIRI